MGPAAITGHASASNAFAHPDNGRSPLVCVGLIKGAVRVLQSHEWRYPAIDVFDQHAVGGGLNQVTLEWAARRFGLLSFDRYQVTGLNSHDGVGPAFEAVAPGNQNTRVVQSAVSIDDLE
jgi:hypothetical protein